MNNFKGVNMKYFEDLKIDINNLDKVVIEQPTLNMQYHELFAEKLDELNEQKRKVKIEDTELKELYAQLYLFNKKTGEKISENMNESMILVNDEYKLKQKKYFDSIKKMNDIEKEFNILDGVIKSFQQRKNSIEKVIELFIYGYNSSINIKENNFYKKIKGE